MILLKKYILGYTSIITSFLLFDNNTKMSL